MKNNPTPPPTPVDPVPPPPGATTESLEQQIQRVGATKGPRITMADIEANIDSVEFLRPTDPRSCMTICVVRTRNGFEVVGTSACASPANYNAEVGQRVAREDAIDKLWAPMGYQLRTDLARAELEALRRGEVDHDRASDDGMPVKAGGTE